MPNWVQCKMTIAAASKAEAEAICAAITNDKNELDFERIVPPPTNEEYNLNGDWHAWNCEHWGTKWNADEPRCTEPLQRDNSLSRAFTFEFLTAWAAPFKIVEALAKRFQGTLVLLYYKDWMYPEPKEGVLAWIDGREVSHEMRPLYMYPLVDAGSAMDWLEAHKPQ